jgi:hypothetical protein
MSDLEPRRVDGVPPPGMPTELDLPDWVGFAEWRWATPTADGAHELSLVLEVQQRSVSYDDLVELWQLFGTTKIDLETETRNTGGCDTCNYEYEHTTIVVREMTRYSWSST